jgi:hypothetical protein
MLDGHYQQDEVVCRSREACGFDAAVVNGQPARASRRDRSRVGIDPFEPPARPSELTEQSEVKTITTPDIKYAGVRRQTATPAEQSPGFQSAADAVYEAVLGWSKLEGVVGVRVDSRRLIVRRARVQVDQTAATATDGQELIHTGAVLEIGTDRDRFGVLDSTQAAESGNQPEWSRFDVRLAKMLG